MKISTSDTISYSIWIEVNNPLQPTNLDYEIQEFLLHRCKDFSEEVTITSTAYISKSGIHQGFAVASTIHPYIFQIFLKNFLFQYRGFIQ